jgi:hypothetical protein
MKTFHWLLAASIIQTFTATVSVSSYPYTDPYQTMHSTEIPDNVDDPDINYPDINYPHYIHTPPTVIYTTSTCDAGTCNQ